MSESERKVQTESIANIIQKFETFQSSPQLPVVDNELPARPITAPPSLSGNRKTLVQRKDELISRLCEEVCYLNSQIVELQDTKIQKAPQTLSADTMTYTRGDQTKSRQLELFEDNYFIISGAVSPLEEMSANITAVSNKNLNAKEMSLDHEKSEFIEKLLYTKKKQEESSLYGSNKLSLSPKQSNVAASDPEIYVGGRGGEGGTILNVTVDERMDERSGDVTNKSNSSSPISLLDTENDETREGAVSDRGNYRQYFTSSQSDIENLQNEEFEGFENCTSSRDVTVLMSSSDSLMKSEELVFSSDGSTPQNSRGLQRCGGIENLFHGGDRADSSEDRLREYVAKCDWTADNSCHGNNTSYHGNNVSYHGNRTQQSLTFDEMAEWNLSNSDLTNHDSFSCNSEPASPDNLQLTPDNNILTNGYHPNNNHHNGYHGNRYHDSNINHPTADEDPLGAPRFQAAWKSLGNNNDNLQECVEITQDHFSRMMEDFQKMHRYLQDISEQVQDRGTLNNSLLGGTHLACSTELLDNDSEPSSPSNSPRAESPLSTRHARAESPLTTRHARAESPPWRSVNSVQEMRRRNSDENKVTRLKRTKSGVRLLLSSEPHRTPNKPEEPPGLSIRQLVREVCNDEALSEAAALRVQLADKEEEIQRLHCENDDLLDQMSGLDSRILDLSEQLTKLQTLNRSLQAQNFNLSTTLSHKDATFEKVKKYLHKGPPSRSHSSSPLTSIAEVAHNTAAHKYGFLNRSSTSISRRKAIRPWKRRLTVLDNNNISTYKVESVETLIPIKSIVDIHTDTKKAYGKHVIVITTDDNKDHFLQATSHDDMLEWVQHIENLLPSST